MDVRGKLVELLSEKCMETCEQRKGYVCSVEECKRSKEKCCGFYADHLISNGVTVQEWVSVKEPPKERGEYLCYFKYEPESPDVICENTYYGSGRWMSETGRVTHWQYLPQPPKGE